MLQNLLEYTLNNFLIFFSLETFIISSAYFHKLCVFFHEIKFHYAKQCGEKSFCFFEWNWLRAFQSAFIFYQVTAIFWRRKKNLIKKFINYGKFTAENVITVCLSYFLSTI